MTRLEQARAEIARRRALAEAATPAPWTSFGDRSAPWNGWPEDPPSDYWRVGHYDLPAHMDAEFPVDAAFVSVNDPAHVLAVLAAADAALDRHGQWSAVGLAPGDWCPADGDDYPCPDLRRVLDLYAPESTP